MRELFLVRHGESEHHVQGFSGGWTDMPLTGLGLRQARATGARLRELVCDGQPKLYSSDLTRALETAQEIGRALDLTVQQTAQLRELNNGVARGLTEAEARVLRRPVTTPPLDWVPYEGGESWRHMQIRIGSYLSTLDQLERGTVIAVTHANALICAINWWLRIEDDRLLASTMYDAAPASITRLRVAADGCRTIAFLNDSGHLRDGLLPIDSSGSISGSGSD
jgi:probable phosphoglycerate mutase